MAEMSEYLEECVNSQHLTVDVSLVALEFYCAFKERYPDKELDAAPTCKDGVLLALDDGTHYREFEFCNGKWEFFYRNRNTDELYDCDFTTFEDIDDYIRMAGK
jgi:hypothetical protein